MTHTLKIGMVGGGQGAFIGAVHRRAATLDGEAVLVAGALSSTPDKARASGKALGLADARNYGTWQEMIKGEGALAPDQRIGLVSIVTPNDTHFAIAKAFAAAGFNVVVDKPMVHSSEQARDLIRVVEETGVVFAVTYNYTGYPMVQLAAEMVRLGEIGDVRKVIVEYLQGWLAARLESTGQKQADWRTDPARAGLGGALGDIGSHAENLVSTITGLQIAGLCADLTTFVAGRRLDDDAAILLRFNNGARGMLSASQVCIGEENNLTIRVYGDKGSLAWRQEVPNQLRVTLAGGSTRLITRGGPEAGPVAAASTRLPAGHPEGFHEAFANIYRGVFQAIHAKRTGATAPTVPLPFPTVHDGARGVRFIEKAVESSRGGGVWIKLA